MKRFSSGQIPGISEIPGIYGRLRDTGDDEKAKENTAGNGPSASSEPTTRKNQRPGIETTAEEIEFYEAVRAICSEQGTPSHEILYHDTKFWFSVSYGQPKKWFLRFLGNREPNRLVTLLPFDEVQRLAGGFKVEPRHHKTGGSVIYLDNVTQIQQMKELVSRSLEVFKTTQSQTPTQAEPQAPGPVPAPNSHLEQDSLS